MNDRLQQMALFVRTVETGSFSRAAREFGLTQPSASRAIAALEHRDFHGREEVLRHRKEVRGEIVGIRHIAAGAGERRDGRQAVDLKLIDEIGDEGTAIAWLGKEKNVDTKLPVRDYDLHSRFSDLPFLHAAMRAVLDAAGKLLDFGQPVWLLFVACLHNIADADDPA